MSQKAFLRQFDQDAVGAFLAAGLADAGTYLPPGAAPDAVPVPVDVMVDRDVRDFSDPENFVPVATSYTVVGLQLRQVAPAKGGLVTADGDTFKLEHKLHEDGSLSRWVVVRA